MADRHVKPDYKMGRDSRIYRGSKASLTVFKDVLRSATTVRFSSRQASAEFSTLLGGVQQVINGSMAAYPKNEVLVLSDQGSPYARADYLAFMSKHKLIPSMSRRGNDCGIYQGASRRQY